MNKMTTFGENIRYYENALTIISMILKGEKKHFSYEEGASLVGDSWLNIAHEMRDCGAGYSDYGGYVATRTGNLMSLKTRMELELERVRNEERLYDISIQEKTDNIKYGKRGYRISIFAITLSLTAILTEIVLRILKL